jgi:hypothetical protein
MAGAAEDAMAKALENLASTRRQVRTGRKGWPLHDNWSEDDRLRALEHDVRQLSQMLVQAGRLIDEAR